MAEQEQEDTSLMEDLASAWDSFERTEEDEPDVSTEPEPIAASAEPEGQDDSVPESADADVHAEAGEGEAEAVDAPVEDEKPPVGLSPEAREHWKDVPQAVKADIAKREKDFAQGIQK